MDQKKPFPLLMAASLDHQGHTPESHSMAKAHTFPTSTSLSKVIFQLFSSSTWAPYQLWCNRCSCISQVKGNKEDKGLVSQDGGVPTTPMDIYFWTTLHAQGCKCAANLPGLKSLQWNISEDKIILVVCLICHRHFIKGTPHPTALGTGMCPSPISWQLHAQDLQDATYWQAKKSELMWNSTTAWKVTF